MPMKRLRRCWRIFKGIATAKRKRKPLKKPAGNTQKGKRRVLRFRKLTDEDVAATGALFILIST